MKTLAKLSDWRLPYYIYALFIAMLLIAPAKTHADTKLSFGLYTSDKPTALVKKFRPILNSLEKSLSEALKTKVSIKLSITKTYEQGVLAIAKGEVDFARLGPASFIQAHNLNPNISLLAMETKKGKKHFQGVICVHQNSKIKSINDLHGKRFAFGNKRSTIGRYLSQQYLLKNGIKAKNIFSFDYLGRHDKVGYAVAQKKYDAGALKKSTLNKLVRKGLPLKAIASFENITKPWVAREGLNEKVFLALQTTLLNLKDKQILKSIKKDGFTSSSLEDYKTIQSAIKNNKEFFN